MEKVWGVWIEDQTSHNILLSQSLTQGSAPIVFRSVRAERGEETAEGKCEAAEMVHETERKKLPPEQIVVPLMAKWIENHLERSHQSRCH